MFWGTGLMFGRLPLMQETTGGASILLWQCLVASMTRLMMKPSYMWITGSFPIIFFSIGQLAIRWLGFCQEKKISL